MPSSSPRPGGKRGRPPKFGRPGRVVALTLPSDVVTGLRKLHPDLAWAIVALFHNRRDGSISRRRAADAELVEVSTGRSLIVVNRAMFRRLPGVHVVALPGGRGFLTLKPGYGIADLELAVLDRLAVPSLAARECKALKLLRARIRRWRRDPQFTCETRSIILIQRARRTRDQGTSHSPI